MTEERAKDLYGAWYDSCSRLSFEAWLEYEGFNPYDSADIIWILKSCGIL